MPNRMLLLIFRLGFYIGLLLGFYPMKYNEVLIQFETSKFWLTYSFFFIIGFSYLYLTSGIIAISLINPMVAIAFVNLTMLTIVITYIMQCIYNRKVVKFLNMLIRFIGEFERIIGDYSNDYQKLMWMFILKVNVIGAIAQYAVVSAMSHLFLFLTGERHYLSSIVISIAYILQTMIPNLFYGFLLIITFFYKLLNRRVMSLIGDANAVMQGFDSMKIQKYCDLSDRIEELMHLHKMLTKLTKFLNHICAIQLLISTINFFGVLVIVVCI